MAGGGAGKLFNGRVFSIDTITATHIDGHMTEFRRIVAQMLRPELFEALRVRPLAVCSVLQCAGGLVVGRRHVGAFYQFGMWQLPPAGSVDEGALRPDRTLDIAGQLLKELHEELGLSAKTAMSATWAWLFRQRSKLPRYSRLASRLSALSPLGRPWRLGRHHVPCRGARRAATGVRLHRWHDRTGPSKGLGCECEQISQMSPRFNRDAAAQAEALGRSRGGFGRKIVGVCDAAGRLVDFLLLPSEAHELAPSLTLLKRLPEAPD